MRKAEERKDFTEESAEDAEKKKDGL